MYDGFDIFLRDMIDMCRTLCTGPLVVLVEGIAACCFPRIIANCDAASSTMLGVIRERIDAA